MNSTAAAGHASRGRHVGADSRPGWRAVNITPAERAGQIITGLAAAAAEAVLLAAGLDLAVTRALGHRPLYARLGYRPGSLRSPR